MPQDKKTPSRDYPLAPTPAIKDNTFVGKPSAQWQISKPSYKYVEADVVTQRGGKQYSKEDSTNYEKGFRAGLERDNFPYPFASSKGGYLAGRLEGNETKKPKLYKK